MPATRADPDLPDEVDFSHGTRGGLLPRESGQRADLLQKRVQALQGFGIRLREAAEHVAQRAERRGATYVVPEQEMRALLHVLGLDPDRSQA
jgi:hypothetical protein